MTLPWSFLENNLGQNNLGPAHVREVWRRGLGRQFALFRAAFLQRRQEAARFVPCPWGCGCAHEVISHGSADIVGVCRCERWSCDDLKLDSEDIVVWELSWPRLARALGGALGLHCKYVQFDLAATRQIGSWSADGVPVILTIQAAAEAFQHVVAALAGRLQSRFVLLAPSSQYLDAGVIEFLAHAGAGFFALESIILMTEQGTLQPARPPGELFAAFTPQPKEADESVMRRAFALVRTLDSETILKSPTVLAVFSHYCVDGMNVSQIARKFHCSRGTVLNRLGLIRRRTGVQPESFRHFSPHIGELENRIFDSRAQRIHRPSLVRDPEDEE